VDLVDDPATVETTVHPGASIRLVDVESVLEWIEYPDDAAGSLVLGVEDPVADWNDGTFRLDIDAGSATVEVSADTPDATLGVGPLSQLVVGYRTADRLVSAGELTIDDRETRSLLDAAFPSREVFLREEF
jgi:predicted acetyltransferase